MQHSGIRQVSKTLLTIAGILLLIIFGTRAASQASSLAAVGGQAKKVVMPIFASNSTYAPVLTAAGNNYQAVRAVAIAAPAVPTSSETLSDSAPAPAAGTTTVAAAVEANVTNAIRSVHASVHNASGGSLHSNALTNKNLVSDITQESDSASQTFSNDVR